MREGIEQRLAMWHAWKGFDEGYILHGRIEGDGKGMNC